MTRAIGVTVTGLFVVCVIGLLTSGCYKVPRRPMIGAAPPTPEQIATCRTELSVRNWANVLAAGFGGAGGLAGGVAADLNSHPTAQVGVQIGAVVMAAAALSMVVTGGVEANNYGANRCDQVLAPP